MYAIFETGGKQYKVCAGDVIRIEKISGDAGEEVKFGNVVAFSDGDSLITGTPFLDATVNATIVSTGRGGKIIVFKFKAKKDYRRKQGHRQPYTEIEIDNFTVDGKELGEKPEKPVVEEAPEAEEAEEPAAEEQVKEEKPAKSKGKAKASKDEAADEAEADEAPEADEAVEVAEADEANDADEAAEAPEADETPEAPEAAVKSASSMTKADIMARLDELGAEYKKSAKKDELLAILDGAEGK